LTAGAPSAQNPAAAVQQAEMLKRVRRYEDVPLSAGDPRSAVQKLVRDLILDKPAEEILKTFSRQAREVKDEDNIQGINGVRGVLRAQFARQGVPSDTAADIAVSILQLSVEGDGAICCRVRVHEPIGNLGSFYVVKEDDEYRILDSTRHLGAVARHPVELAEAGDMKAARQWLDWARDERPLGGGDDPLAGSAFPRFWTKGAEATVEEVRIAAAVLLGESRSKASEAVALLEEARAGAIGDEQIRLDLALGAAYGITAASEKVLGAAERLLAAHPSSERAFGMLIGALGRLKRWEEVEGAARERLERLPNDVAGLRTLAQVAQRRGDFAEATRLHRQLVEAGKAEAGDYNNMAWQALFDPGATAEALELGQRAERISQSKDAGILHTVACLYAEAGRTTEARQVALQAMEIANMEEPSESFWFVFGRIAEEFGEVEAAKAAYRRAIPEKLEEDPFLPTSELARRRLAGLGDGAGENVCVEAGKPR
ncbi:MAG: hypothetical protein ACRD4U_08910, partial [Candidatus Acidiferrales bacterium]